MVGWRRRCRGRVISDARAGEGYGLEADGEAFRWLAAWNSFRLEALFRASTRPRKIARRRVPNRISGARTCFIPASLANQLELPAARHEILAVGGGRRGQARVGARRCSLCRVGMPLSKDQDGGGEAWKIAGRGVSLRLKCL